MLWPRCGIAPISPSSASVSGRPLLSISTLPDRDSWSRRSLHSETRRRKEQNLSIMQAWSVIHLRAPTWAESYSTTHRLRCGSISCGCRLLATALERKSKRRLPSTRRHPICLLCGLLPKRSIWGERILSEDFYQLYYSSRAGLTA